MEPVKWSQHKTRAVLNEAIEGDVGENLLRAAAEAVSVGYDGSLSRSIPALELGPAPICVKEALALTSKQLLKRLNREDELWRWISGGLQT